MVEWNDPRVVVAIYAAIVATVSLLWNIIVSIKNNIRKIKVVVTPRMAFSKDQQFGTYSPSVGILKVQATNYTKEDIYIKSWSIILSNKIDLMKHKTNEICCFDEFGTIEYPYQLKKGDVFSDISNVSSIINAIGKKISSNSKMQVCVYDTFGKKYKSGKFIYKIILDLLEAEELSRKKHINSITTQ